MAKVRIEAVISSLDYEMKQALEEALLEVAPGADVDCQHLYSAFLRQVGYKCSTWETVPDRCVEL